MFEAVMDQGATWKKVVEAMKDLVTESNFDCSPTGVTIHAMDTSHVALVHLLLHFDGFTKYQCERGSIMGINLSALSKVLKIVDNTDELKLRHEDDSDVLILSTKSADTSKLAEYQLKLMEIEAETLGIPEMEYKSKVTFSSSEFVKVVRDMAVFGDTVTITVDRNGVKFAATGDIGEGYAYIKSTNSVVGATITNAAKRVKKEQAIKAEPHNEEQMNGLGDAATAPQNGGAELPKDVVVEMSSDEPISLSFALRFFNIFAKGASLSDRVTLCFAQNAPCMVEFKIADMGYLRYYLAPKLDDA